MKTLTVSAQNAELVIDIDTLPADSLAICLEYGIRRKYQDTVNSIAKKLRDAGEPVDGNALLADMHKRVMESLLSVRGESTSSDPLDKYRREIVREIISSDKESAAYKGYVAIDAKDQAARNAYLLDLAARKAGVIDPLAEERRDAELEKKKKVKAISF